MDEQNNGKYLLNGTRKKRRKTRKRRRSLWLLSTVALILVCVLLCVFFLTRRTDSLYGHWQIDDVTSYRFDGRGGGALVVLDREYPFRYTATEAELTLDFEDASATDTTYRYTQNGGSLTLEVGTGEEKTQYTLTRK